MTPISEPAPAGPADSTPAPLHSASVQDYVKVIYALGEWSHAPVTPARLAKRLGVANSSVTGMLAKLVRQELVSYVAYTPIELTNAGLALALTMVRRHRLLETFLARELGYSWDEVHNEAELLEHTVSERFIEQLDRRLQRPQRDPHGDPIPSRNGTVLLPRARPLSELDAGDTGTLARVSDENAELLRYLAGKGVSLDTPVTVLGRQPFGSVVQVRFGDGGSAAVLDAGEELAHSLWISAATTNAEPGHA